MEYSLCSIQKKDHSLFSFLTPHLRIVLLSIMLMAGLPAALHAGANDDYYTTTVDQPVTGNVLDNDTGEEKEVVSSTDPSHGTLSGVYADGSFTYTPDTGYSGNDSFNYWMKYCSSYTMGYCINWKTRKAKVSINILSANNLPPVAEDDTATTYQNRSVTIKVLDNDSDPDGNTLEVTGTSNGPSHGSVTINDDNTITYTPATDYVGEDRFDYTISDGHGGTASATVTITVNELEIVENADDLCYEKPVHSGLFCMDMGICAGGIGCKTSYPLRNIGDSALNDVVAYYDESGMGGSFGSSCGTEPSGSCKTVHDISFGPVGFFGKATEFDMDTPIDPDDTEHAIWTQNFAGMSCFNREKLYGTYIKDGKLHRGKIKPCVYGDGKYRPFTLRYQNAFYGNMITIGNTVAVAPQAGRTYDGILNGQADCSTYKNGPYIDNEEDTTNQDFKLCAYYADRHAAFPTSEARIRFPRGHNIQIKWAGLYWQALVKDGYDLKHMQIKIRHQNASDYSTIDYDYLDWVADDGKEGYTSYSAFKDITNYFVNNGYQNGKFYVGDIPMIEGRVRNLGTFGAWTLLIVYEDKADKIRQFSIYDGYQIVSRDTPKVDIDISGFLTPSQLPIKSNVSVFAAEGDKYIPRDYLKVKGPEDSGWYWLKHSEDLDQTFDSSIHTVHSFQRSPSPSNNQGIDIQTFNIGTDGRDILRPSQTRLSFRFGSDQDTYWPSMIAFNTELYTPKLCYDYTYGQYGSFITVPDLTRFMIEGDFDSDVPLNVKFYIQNTENSDVTLAHVNFNYTDINTSFASYRPDSTYRKVGKGSREHVSDDGRETNATDDRGIPIGSISQKEYFYTYLDLNINPNHPTTFALPIHADIDYDLVVNFQGKLFYLGHQTSKLSDMDPCRPSPVYQPAYGAFNVVQSGMTRSDNPYYYYNLPTQVVQRNGNFLIESMDPNALNRSKSITTIVGTELLDISGFHLTNANCLDPNATVASDKRVWTILDGNYKAPLSQQEMKNANFFNRAVRNAAFRINYLTTQDGQLVTLRKNGDLYIIDSFSNIRNSDSCSETCTDQISTTGVPASVLKACAECLYKNSNAEPLCSRDNFSIRPESYRVVLYDLNQSDFNQTLQIQNNTPAAADLNLVAGYTYRLDINATDHHNGLATPGYYTREVNGSLTWSPNGRIVTDCNDEHNITQNPRFKNGASDPFYLKMPNVGRYTLEYNDTRWTEVDSNATLMQHHRTAYFRHMRDCLVNSSVVRSSDDYRSLNGCIISSVHSNNESGYQTKYTDMNLSFYPYKFTIAPITSQNGRRIYINTPSPYDKNMSYNINTIFRAVDYHGNALSNFVNHCYADDVNMSITLKYLAGEPNATIDREPYLSYDLIDINGSGDPIFYNDPDYVPDLTAPGFHMDLTTPSATFTKKGSPNSPLIITDQNASNFVKDMNGSIRIDLGLNYPRHYNTPLNPRKIRFIDFNITYRTDPSTLYADMTNHHKIKGSLPLNDTVTFVYGRVLPSLNLYDDVTDSSVTTPISVVIYCDESNCAQYGINPTADRSSEFGWYLNTQHRDGVDGNVYLSVRSVNGGSLTDASVTPAYTSTNPTPLTFNGGVSNAIDENVKVQHRNGAPLPLTVRIDLNISGNNNEITTDPWFIFNTAGYDNINIPELFDVHFSGPGGWTGYGKTGNVVESNASRHKNRRLGW